LPSSSHGNYSFLQVTNTAAGDATVMLEIKTAPFWFLVAAVMALAGCDASSVALREVMHFLHGGTAIETRPAYSLIRHRRYA